VAGGPAAVGTAAPALRRECGAGETQPRPRAVAYPRGVLEQTTVDVLRNNGLSERMDREGQPHDGMKIVWRVGVGP
jgi:FAD binding domain-containing protein